MEALWCILLSSFCVDWLAKKDLLAGSQEPWGFFSGSANELHPLGGSPSFPSTVNRRLELSDRQTPFLHLRISSRTIHYDLGTTYSLLIIVHMVP